jgi:O-antigen/teichoic acid export membrane protein
VPLGIVSILASLYFTIDQVILGWLVPSQALGHYAAAVRLLSLVVMVPGFVMLAGVPGLSANAENHVTLSRFAATLTHWIAVTALPLCIGLAVFAEPAIRIAFGPSYGESVELLRILMLAAVLALASNVLGMTLMSLSIVKPQLVFNLIGLTVNIVGNILLVPHYGVVASAWLTVACESIAVGYGLAVLRKRLSYWLLFEKLWRPCAAAVIAALPGLVLGADSVVAIAASTAVFIVAMFAFRAWPAGMLPRRLQARAAGF